jgi:2-polyprenyl-3-methyl-5-hydroxy-6-metoxy-1,4-benzoquinol methylase
MRKDGDVVEIPGDYQYRALTEGIAVQRFWHHAKRLAVTRYLPPAKTDFCVDVGCGSGIVSEFLGRHAAQVLGIDCSPAAVDFATRKFATDNVSFRQGFVDGNFDLHQAVDKIYCIEVIEHIYLSQAGEMLRAFHRALKPGGAVFLTTPNSHSLWPLIERTMDCLRLAPRLAQDQHVEGYSRKKLAVLCEANGFQVETVAAMCFAAPWLALANWRFAERAFAWESAFPHTPGAILVAVLRKPAGRAL